MLSPRPLENPFADLAHRQTEFINWIMQKLQDHEQRLDEVVIAADMLSNRTASKAYDHESRLDSIAEQLKSHYEKIAAGRAPSALKTIAGALKKDVKVRLNSEVEDLTELEDLMVEKTTTAPRPEQTAMGDRKTTDEQVQTMEGTDKRQLPQAQMLANGSMESMDLPETLQQAIDTTTVGCSPGNFNTRSRRTCMIPKFDDMLNDEDEIPIADSAPYLPDFTPQPQSPDMAMSGWKGSDEPQRTTPKLSIGAALAGARANCVEQMSFASQDGEQSPSASPRSVTPGRARTHTQDSIRVDRGVDQVDLDSYPVGHYIIVAGVVVTDGCESKTPAGRLKEGDVVKVLLVEVDGKHRVRGAIEEPKGWINIRNAATNQTYAEKASECGKCKQQKLKGFVDTDGEWCCVDCRSHNRSTRRMPQRKCDSCSQSATLGKTDEAAGSWYCNTCWDTWK